MQSIINSYGELTIAAFTATNKLEILIQQPILAWGNSLAAYTAQNVGANKKERIKKL